jgi:hypothetical protein
VSLTIGGERMERAIEKYYIGHHTEEDQCLFCGFPIYVGDFAYFYNWNIYCSKEHAKNERDGNWKPKLWD